MNHEVVFKQVLIITGVPVLTAIGSSYTYDFIQNKGNYESYFIYSINQDLQIPIPGRARG